MGGGWKVFTDNPIWIVHPRLHRQPLCSVPSTSLRYFVERVNLLPSLMDSPGDLLIPVVTFSLINLIPTWEYSKELHKGNIQVGQRMQLD